jgi:hypothetical protein
MTHISNGEASENLTTWEGDMHEESDWRVGKTFANHLGEKHEMVIVNPD